MTTEADKLSEEMRAGLDLGRQYQAFPHRPQDGVQGDCYRTAVACVLGVERDSVPHTHDELTGPEAEKFIDSMAAPARLATHLHASHGEHIARSRNRNAPPFWRAARHSDGMRSTHGQPCRRSLRPR